jgi:hypothetical protein
VGQLSHVKAAILHSKNALGRFVEVHELEDHAKPQ